MARFGRACQLCPLQASCTSSPTGRRITIHPQEARLQALYRVEQEATARLLMVPAPPPDYVQAGPPPADVDGAVERALAAAQHRPVGWRERAGLALRRAWSAD